MSSSRHSGLYRFLNRLLLRTPLSAEEQEAILDLPCTMRQIAPHTDLVAPGETVEHACLVSKGIMARFDQMRGGQRQITAFHIAGDMCDLQSVLTPTVSWGTASMNAATVLFIPHAALRRAARAYPALAVAFWRDGASDASVLAKWIANIGRQDSRARLAHLMCEFGLRSELAGLGTRMSFTFDVTQEQLADALGLTSVHVNRTLQRLRAEGVLTTRGRAVDVLDWERLALIAEFDPGYLLAQRPKPWQRVVREAAELVGAALG